MRLLVGILIAAGLSFSGLASAQEAPAKWKWVSAKAAANWFVAQGTAEVQISGGRIHAILRDDSDQSVSFEFSGTVKPMKNSGDRFAAIVDDVSVKVSVPGSDYTINDPYHGTYRKRIYDAKAAKAFGQRSAEFISLTDGYSFLGLERIEK